MSLEPLYSWVGGLALGGYFGKTAGITGAGIGFTFGGPQGAILGNRIGTITGGFVGGVQGSVEAEQMYDRLFYDSWDRH